MMQSLAALFVPHSAGAARGAFSRVSPTVYGTRRVRVRLAAGNPMSAARIRRLTLSNFRSYRAAALTLDAQLAVLVGPNGAGKTNLIEAISFLAPGRGLRRATLDEVAFVEGDGSWAVAAELEGALGLATLGTGITPPSPDDAASLRKCRIDGEPASSAAAFADHVSIVWLTPAMDGLVRRAGVGAAALSRPPRARRRRHAFGPRQRAGAIACGRAIGCWSSKTPIRTGSTRSSTRPRTSRSRLRRRAPRRCADLLPRSHASAIRPRRSRGPASRSTAGSRTP